MLTLAMVLGLGLGLGMQDPPPFAGDLDAAAWRPGGGAALLQEEPPSRGGARFRFSFDVGAGQWEHDSDDGVLDGDTDAGFFRLRGEVFSRKGFGGGLAFEGIGSDDDLFEDDAIGRSEASVGDLYPYFAYELQTRRFRCPFRIGPAFRSYELEHRVTGAETRYHMATMRMQAEPDFALVASDTVRWSLFALVSLAAGGGEIENDPGVDDDEVATLQHGFEIGTRLQFGNARIGLAFVERDDHYRDSVFADVDTRFVGGMLSFGIVF